MFYALFVAIVVVALAASLAVVRFFDPAVHKILQRTLGQDLADAWRRYISFAILVAGISGGYGPGIWSNTCRRRLARAVPSWKSPAPVGCWSCGMR
jgi:TctA family transporter